MRVVIAGGHGQIALLLSRRLASRGDAPVGVVRNPGHVEDVVDAGAEAVVLDLERAALGQLAEVLAGADAVVFAAGAGPGSGAARKDTVDRAAAALLADAAERAGVRRYLMVSAIDVDRVDPGVDPGDDVFAAYLRAKKLADDDLRARDLDWTVIRPGRLTNAPGTGLVRVGDLALAEVSRADVAHVLAEVLGAPHTIRRSFDVVGGDRPVEEAIAAL